MDLPPLIDESQMQLVIHEVGHALHVICTDYEPMYGAFDVGRDLIEVPAMWAERQYQEVPAKFDIDTRQQYVLAKFDMQIHSLEFESHEQRIDLLDVFMEIERDTEPAATVPCKPLWMFHHLVNEYAGTYYGYKLSELLVPKREVIVDPAWSCAKLMNDLI